MTSKVAVVVGSGVAGLVSACLLSSKGYKVSVYERSGSYGGKLSQIKGNGYTFDGGPSLFTLPHLLDDVFIECNKNPKDYYKYVKLPLVTKYFYPNEKILPAYANLKKFKEALYNLGEEPKLIDSYFNDAEDLYNLVRPVFLENPIKQFAKHFPLPFWKSLKSIFKMRPFSSVHKKNSEYFKTTEAQQLFDRYATYNGSNPFKAPSSLTLIAHLEHATGAYYLEGGMRTLANVLYTLACELGVSFSFNSNVEEIIVDKNTAKGVFVNKKQINADKVICNVDVNLAYKSILKKQNKPNLFLNQEKSSSAIVFYWGIKGNYDKLELHNILFSKNYKKEFDKLSEGKIYKDPTIYLYISSKLNPSHAPRQSENWFTMINAPYIQNQHWEEVIEKARYNIIYKIKNMLQIDIESSLEYEKVISPISIQEKTGSYLGALYGNSSNSISSAFLRHPNYFKIKNLAFAGGSVHPGGGIPLCILSAKIACSYE